jgi:hypothetical protein
MVSNVSNRKNEVTDEPGQIVQAVIERRNTQLDIALDKVAK